MAWDTILICMLAYFVISIINSSVQDYLMQKDEDKIKKLEDEKKSLSEKKSKDK